VTEASPKEPIAQPIRETLTSLYSALEEGRPWSLVRLGDGELKILGMAHAPLSHVENRVASTSDLGMLRRSSIQAIRNADWVGWHQDPWLGFWMEAFGLLPALYERSAYAWVNLHMGLRRSFVERVLRQEPLFLIGEPMERWLADYLRPLGLGEKAKVYRGQSTPSNERELRGIFRAIEASEARVIMASLGVWALPVCDCAKGLGKIGIDWGHAPDHNLQFNEPHWQYRLNTCCPDSPEGTMQHYRHAGAADQCLPV